MDGPNKNPHQNQPVYTAGEGLDTARAIMVMLHGRGASAQDILTLADPLDEPGFAFIAPQAAGNTWYPYSFLSPLEKNEPWLSSALEMIGNLLARLEDKDFPAEKVILMGFSQGACLALEFAVRNARRYRGLVGLSGGLIGPQGMQRSYTGSLESTPVFMGCSEADPHIPKDRFLESAAVLEELGGKVSARLYPDLGHEVNLDELEQVRAVMEYIP
jgi:predicted esterase